MKKILLSCLAIGCLSLAGCASDQPTSTTTTTTTEETSVQPAPIQPQ